MPGLFSHLAQRIAHPESTPRPVLRAQASPAGEAPGIAEAPELGPSMVVPGVSAQTRAFEEAGARDASGRQPASAGAAAQATIALKDVTARRVPPFDGRRVGESGVTRERLAPHAMRTDASGVARPSEFANSPESVGPDAIRPESRMSRADRESDLQAARSREIISQQRRLQNPSASQTRDGAPTVHVSIGRIEIRTQRAERAEPVRVPAIPSSRVSLDDYLKGTPGGSS